MPISVALSEGGLNGREPRNFGMGRAAGLGLNKGSGKLRRGCLVGGDVMCEADSSSPSASAPAPILLGLSSGDSELRPV